MITLQIEGAKDLAERLKDWADLRMPDEMIEGALIIWIESKVELLVTDIEHSYDYDKDGLKHIIDAYEGKFLDP